MAKLSIVIPVYYNSDTLDKVFADIEEKIISQLENNDTYEIIFVDDGSGDNSFSVMKEIAKKDSNVKIIRLSKNFGSHAASLCGILNATGDCVATKAADLQEPSELILKMFYAWKEGNNVVLAVRENREDPSLFSSLYYWITKKFALPTMPEGGFDQFLIDRKVIEMLRRMDDPHVALTGKLLWMGYKTAEIGYVRVARESGKGRWTLKKKFALVGDTLFGYSNTPILAIALIGAIFLILGLFIFMAMCIKGVDNISLLLPLMLFLAGCVMLSVGIVGEYVIRAYDSAKRLPPYIIEDGPMSYDESKHNNQC